MEYVDGPTLAERLRAGPLPAVEAARFGRILAEAVDYAHQRGVLHRDLKPSNVLLDGAGQPRITDFGLAKRMDGGTDLTLTGELLGSPQYLSPEQAAGLPGAVGPPSDVYSLGALLYEALTGRPPFLGSSLAETLTQIRDAEPVAPRCLVRGVPRDLETVVLRCLEKHPDRRYGTAGELADDLGRFLRGEGTLARPIGVLERSRRWCRRKPVQATACGLLIGAAVLTGWMGYRTRLAFREADRLSARLASDLRRVRWEKAEAAIRSGRVTDGLVSFARLLRDDPGDRVLAARLVWLLSHRDFAVPIGPALSHDGPVTWIEFEKTGDAVVTASLDGSARLWRTRDGAGLGRIDAQEPLVRASFVGGGASLLVQGTKGGLSLWRRSDAARLRVLPRAADAAPAAAVSPDGRRIALAVAPNRVRVFDAGTGVAAGGTMDHEARVLAVEFLGDGVRLVTGSEDGRIALWDSVLGGVPLRTGHRDGAITMLAGSTTGDRLAVGTRSGHMVLYVLPDLDQPRMELRRDGEEQLLRFSPDASRLLTAWFGEWPQLWDTTQSTFLTSFVRGDHAVVLDAQWSPGGDQVLFGYRSGMAELLDPRTLQSSLEPVEHQGPIVRVALHPRASELATASHDGTARLWTVRSRPVEEPWPRLPGRVGQDLRSWKGRWVLTAWKDASAFVCDASTGEPVLPPLVHPEPVRSAVLSPDGRHLLTASRGTRVWDLDTGRVIQGPGEGEEEVASAVWLSGGDAFVTASRRGTLSWWEVGRGRGPLHWVELEVGIHGLHLGDRERTLAVLGDDASARLYDARDRRQRCPPLRHRGRIWAVDFGLDGRRVVTASADRTAQVWDMDGGRPLGPALNHGAAVLSTCFSPDGRTLATGAEDGRVHLWDVATGRALTPPLVHPDRVWILVFSEDGRRLFTSADQVESRLWDVATGLPLTGPVAHEGPMLRGWRAPEGDGFLTVTHRGAMRRILDWSAPGPAPAWLPELAEALAGRRRDADGEVRSAPVDILQRGGDRGAGPSEDFYERWLAGRFGDGP